MSRIQLLPMPGPVLLALLWMLGIASAGRAPCMNSTLSIDSIDVLDLRLKPPDESQIAKASEKTRNTLRLDWEATRQTFVMLTHWTEPSEIPTLLDPVGQHGRTGNKFKQCVNTIWEGIMCNAIVRCRELAIQTEWNVYGIEYVDARSIYQGMYESGMLTHGGVTLTRRSCRAFSTAREANMAKLPEVEVPIFGQIRPIIGRLTLGYMGSLGRGTVFGRECPNSGAASDVLIGHVRGGDLFESRYLESLPKTIRKKGQPPLKFYDQLIRAHNRSIIYVEDHKNPVGIALATLSQAQPELHLTVQFNAPWEDVVFAMQCAKNVAIGRTTMAIAVGASWNVEKLLVCNSCGHITDTVTAPADVLWSLPVLNYTPFEGWEQTPAQLREMVDKKVAMAQTPLQCSSRCSDTQVTPEEILTWTRHVAKRAAWEREQLRTSP